MYARLTRYALRSEDPARAEAAMKEAPAVEMIAAIEGCRGVWVMWREEDEGAKQATTTILSLWETREQAERLAEVIRPQVMAMLDEAGMEPTAPPEVEVLLAEGRALA